MHEGINMSHKIRERKLKPSWTSAKGNRSREKIDSTLFEHKPYSYPVLFTILFWALPKTSCTFKLNTVTYRLLWLLASAFKTTWLLLPVSTLPSHHNLRTCANVWPLCCLSVYSQSRVDSLLLVIQTAEQSFFRGLQVSFLYLDFSYSLSTMPFCDDCRCAEKIPCSQVRHT